MDARAILSLVLLALEVIVVQGHPQCLNSLPPFRRKNHICKDYTPYSCCRFPEEDRIRTKAREFSQVYKKDKLKQQCKELFLKVLCTECSPWAQHIYEGTPTRNGKSFPSLCRNFCLGFYRTCYKAIFDYYGANSTEYSRGSARRFCRENQATDNYYCYPNIVDGPDFPPNVPTSSPSKNCLCGSKVVGGLRNPIAAISPGDDSGRLFIAEQRGQIKVLTNERELLSKPFLDISRKVHTSSWPGDERGLLGLAFDPNYRENGRFYVYYSSYTNRRHISKVSEFKVSSTSPNVTDPNSERVIFTINQPEGNHNGGQLFFKDGYLYIALGDGGGAGDRHGRVGNGLDTSTLLGSILRVDVSNPNVTYTIPPDNPFADGIGGRPEIFAYGLRNPWRCSVDRGDADGRGKGRIFCGDVGQKKFEEIDIIEKGGNYGWRAYEGFHCFDQMLCPNVTDSVKDPIYAYPHRIGRSVTGGYVYRGACFPRLRGKYIYADFEQGSLFALSQNATSGEWTNEEICLGGSDQCHNGLIGGHFGHVLSFAEDTDGEIYVLVTTNVSNTSPKGSLILLVDPNERSKSKKCKLTFKGL